VQVLVRHNNVDQALKMLKRKMQREGVFREMKFHRHYEKPEREVREKAEAIRRARKLVCKKLQREGLLPMKPRVVPGTVGGGGPARTPRFQIDWLSHLNSTGVRLSTVEVYGKQNQGDATEGGDAGE
jgi:small subunit ribosomal protein S21